MAAPLLLLAGLLVLSSGHRSRSVQPEERAEPAAANAFTAYFQKLTRDKRTETGGRVAPRVVEHLSAEDVFIAVKTTAEFHESRLELLLETWMSRSLAQTFVFTDAEDPRLWPRLGAHLISTHCSGAHTRQALSCKMSHEYDAFLRSGRKWFCHVDDDNYVNVEVLLTLLCQYQHTQDVYLGRPSTGRPLQAPPGARTTAPQVSFWFATGGAGFCLSRALALRMQPWTSGGAFMNTSDMIQLPDDCTVGFIVEGLLGVALTCSPLFHSHLENLSTITDLHSQATLSYGPPDSDRNTVNIRGGFSTRRDPTRLRSLHCLLYPDTSWCPRPSAADEEDQDQSDGGPERRRTGATRATGDRSDGGPERRRTGATED